jgi:hypothetical protein
MKKQKLTKDYVNAIDRLALLRYFASGLIAGGAGVTLTMILSGTNIHPQSFIALGCLNILLLTGTLYFLRSGVRWMGIPFPRFLTVGFVIFLLYQVVSSILIHPMYTIVAFTSQWWGLVIRAVITTFFGAAFRFWAEMEIDDLEFGLEHEVRSN